MNDNDYRRALDARTWLRPDARGVRSAPTEKPPEAPATTPMEPARVIPLRRTEPRPALPEAVVAETFRRVRPPHRKALVLAASTFAGTFTPGDLVIRAHSLFPTLFSLKGHPQFPCSAAVLSKLYGAEGIVAMGFVEALGHGVYRTSKRGQKHAREIASEVCW